MAEGIIVKSLSGFYDVDAEGTVFTCKAKGRFRLDGLSPLVGDRVIVEPLTDTTGVIRHILPRRNSFIRPAVANIDAMVYVATGSIPATDPFLIDRVSVIAVNAKCDCIVCLNKCDLNPADELYRIYERAGFPVVRTSAVSGEGIDRLRDLLEGRISAFAGNSGVGKSSLLNALDSTLALDTGEVSMRLGRGRHTTRHVQLYTLGEKTFLADTPGFASFEVEMVDEIEAGQLQYCFPDFESGLGSCRFADCRHLAEPGCAILEAVQNGDISSSRHASYRKLYGLISDHTPW